MLCPGFSRTGLMSALLTVILRTLSTLVCPFGITTEVRYVGAHGSDVPLQGSRIWISSWIVPSEATAYSLSLQVASSFPAAGESKACGT